VHDALGRAGGARRIEDVERVIELEALELDVLGRERADEIPEGDSDACRR